jgi:hypothetical protein
VCKKRGEADHEGTSAQRVKIRPVRRLILHIEEDFRQLGGGGRERERERERKDGYAWKEERGA